MRPVHYVWWPLMLGAGLTLPVCGRTLIFHRQRPIAASTKLHEACHAKQIEDWGGWRYVWRHIKVRVREVSLFVKDSPEEKSCYDAERLLR